MTPPRPFPGLPRPLLFAHRGASRLAPENTLESFELATRLGAQVLELDVHATRDGEVVVLHDATLDRTTNGHGPVRDKSYQELAVLDAGARFVTPHGARPFAGRGVVVPRLQDVLRSFSRMAFNIEIKAADPALVRAVLQILDRVGPSSVLLAAAAHRIMEMIEASRPPTALGLSARQAWEVVRGAALGRVPHHLAGRALQIPPFYRGLPLCSRRVVTQAHAAGIPVHLWTINAPARARKYLQRGIDGIMSDDPSALSDVVSQFRGAAT